MLVSCVMTSPLAMLRNRRRMILPLRVLGRFSPKRMSLGLAMGPISLSHHWRNSAATFLTSSPLGRARFKTTKAQIASPVVSSGRRLDRSGIEGAVFKPLEKSALEPSSTFVNGVFQLTNSCAKLGFVRNRRDHQQRLRLQAKVKASL